MPKNPNILLVVFATASILVGACAGSAGAPPAAVKVDPIPAADTGVIESMDGNQWVVNGQAIVVDTAVVRDGPFKIGDTVKIEVVVDQDGSLIAIRVELPEQSDLTDLPVFGADNINDDNINDDNVNEDNANGDNSNDDNGGDDNSSGGGGGGGDSGSGGSGGGDSGSSGNGGGDD